MRAVLSVLLLVLFCTCGFAREVATEAFINCVVAEGSGGRVFALNSRGLEGGEFVRFYFTDDGSQWQMGLRYPAAVAALALHNGRLYALGPEGAAEYDPNPSTQDRDAGDQPARGQWLRSTTWKADWAPKVAAPAGGGLWAFGTDNGVIAVAEFKDGAWPERSDLALETAAVSGRQLLAASRPAGRGAAQLLWIAEGNVVSRATFDGRQWKMLSSIPLPEGTWELAAVTAAGKTTVFVSNADHVITKEHPLLYTEITDSDKGALAVEPGLQPVSGIRHRFMEGTHFMAAAPADGKITIFLVSRSSLDRAAFARGAVSALVRIEEIPLLKRMETPLMLGAMIAVYIIFIGISVRRASRWPRTVEYEDRELTLASWRARIGAFCVDLALILLSVGLIGIAVGTTDWLKLMAGSWSLFLISYFIILESRQGQTPGKSLFGIAVVTQELLPPGFRHVLIRNLLRAIDLPLLGLLVLLNTRTFQRIGDLLGGTLVVEVPRKHADNKNEEE
ncbi:MAG: RDD family protein [Planctomycetes bacterium]|nr:RDD family protein [Planctomycetota bacterium]